MLTGRRPFAAQNEHAVLMAIISNDPTPVTDLRPEVPVELQRIIGRCLERDPNDRYQSAGELVTDLRRFRGDSTPSEDATQTLPSAPSERRTSSVTRRLLPAAAAVVAIVLAAVFYPMLKTTHTRHVTVLPFSCLADDDQTTRLCDGLLDTVTTKLSELRRFHETLSVVPASEVRKQKVASPGDARKVFGVNLVVTGDVQRSGDSLRITLQLVDAARLRQVRSRSITTEQVPDFVLQDHVVAAIEEMLDVELGPAEKRAMMAGGTSQAEAAELYLEARGSLGEEPSEWELTRAMSLYRQALDFDPYYADAMVQLATACYRQFELTHDPIWLEHGVTYALRALDAEPDLPAAHFAAGLCEAKKGAFARAVEHLERAIALDPLRLEAYTALMIAYEAVGDQEKSAAAIDRALRTGPDDWHTYYTIGSFYFNERSDYQRASDFFRRVVELLPESGIGYSALGGCLLYLGDLEGARQQLERGVEIGSNYWVFSNFATLEFYEQNCHRAAELYRQALDIDDSDHNVWNNLAEAYRCADDARHARDAYARAAELVEPILETDPENVRLLINLASYTSHLGEESRARELLSRAVALDIDDPARMFDLAAAYEDLGERDNALIWVERALQAGFPLGLIQSYDGFLELRADPRFVELAAAFAADASDIITGDSEERGGG
jgi:tetratricopeptide (TPR) repeat protein